MEFCSFCYNARIADDDTLNDSNDMSSRTIGESASDFRIMFTSGAGKPVRIEFDFYSHLFARWQTAAFYNPKFCPECGRRLNEYNNSLKG